MSKPVRPEAPPSSWRPFDGAQDRRLEGRAASQSSHWRAKPPTVLVLGVDTQIGLTVVRELGRHGARVVGVAASWRGIGLYSRYVAVRAVSPARDDARLALIRRLAAEHDIEFLMAVSEP